MKDTAIVGWDGSAAASHASDWLADRQAGTGRRMAIVRVVPFPAHPENGTRESDQLSAAQEGTQEEAVRLRTGHENLEVLVRVIAGDPWTSWKVCRSRRIL